MEANNIYFYYNKNGQLISRTPYYENGSIRQVSTFILNLLFEKDFVNPGDTIMLYFKWPTKEDLNELPYVSFYEDYNSLNKDDLTFTHMGFKTFDKDLSKFGILKNVEYDWWKFDTKLASLDGFPNLTELDGNLEFTPKIINQTRAVNVLGTSRVFVERDVTYKSDLKVSTYDLEQFLAKVQQQIPDTFVKKITPGEDYGFGVQSFDIKYEEIDLENESSEKNENINLPIPEIKRDIIVNNIEKDENQTVEFTGTGKHSNPLEFTFNLYKAKDGYGITAFEIGEDGNLYLYDGRSSDDQKFFKYKIDENGFLCIEYPEN